MKQKTPKIWFKVKKKVILSEIKEKYIHENKVKINIFWNLKSHLREKYSPVLRLV